MGRKRNPVEPGEFEDPLCNYDPPEYADVLERVLCEHQVDQMRTQPLVCIEKDATVQDALDQMKKHQCSSVVVRDDGKAVGIFSARDVLNKVAHDPTTRPKPITDFMSHDPQQVYASDCPAKAINLMAVGGFRHIPVIDINDNVVGILGPRRTTQFLEEHLI